MNADSLLEKLFLFITNDYIVSIIIAILVLPSIYFMLKKWRENKDKNNKFQVLKEAVAITIAILSFQIAINQISQVRTEINSNTLNTMNEWYNSIYAEFPKTYCRIDLKKIKCKKLEQDTTMQEKSNLARRYFNLWQNELNHCRRSSLPSGFMDIINHGACRNLIMYPYLIKEFKWWVENHAFHNDQTLISQVNIIIHHAEHGTCESIPQTIRCLIPN